MRHPFILKQPLTKARCFQGAYKFEDGGKKSYDITYTHSKNFKGKFYKRGGDSSFSPIFCLKKKEKKE